MTKRVASGVACCVLFLAVTSRAMEFDNGKVNPSQGERVPGVLVVQLAGGFTPFGNKIDQNGASMGILEVDQLNSKHGMVNYYPLFPRGSSTTKSIPWGDSPMDRWQLLTFDPSVDLDKLADEYAALPQVEKVEFDYYAYIMRTPNDAQYNLMYQLNQANDRDMDAPEAWESTVGNPDVVLADTDTGVLWSHEDLINNIWINPGEDLDGDKVVMDATDVNGIDDDGNGYIDDFIGWDFVVAGSAVWPGEDGTTMDNDPKDFHGHGTHTSGTIAAKTNNAVGVSGVAGGFGASEPGCKIMCLRMGYSFVDTDGSENGRTAMSYVAQAFYYAYRNGATAINYSFGSSNGGGIENATDSTVAHGVVICASAGNSNNSIFGYLQEREDVLCVASTSSSDAKSSFSNYGWAVDISAPGSSIRSTVSNHYTPGYAIFSGTSMSAPQVVGQVGLIRSLNPGLTRQEVFDIIIGTTDNIDAYNSLYIGDLGSGRINLANSLVNLASTNFDGAPLSGFAPLTVQFNDSSATTPTGWVWRFGDGDSAMTQNPSHEFGPGLFNVTLQTETAIGPGLKTKINYVSALAETLSTLDTVVQAGQTVAMDIWATNFQPVSQMILPFWVKNIPAAASFDSIVATGCRTANFEQQQLLVSGLGNGKCCFGLTADANADGSPPPLPPGSGPIARLWFTMNAAVDPAHVIAIDTSVVGISQYTLLFSSPALTYVPEYNAGSISVRVLPGDIDFNGVHDIVDVVSAIDIMFRNGTFPEPPDRVDASCDGEYDVIDVVRIIEFAFRGVEPDYCP